MGSNDSPHGEARTARGGEDGTAVSSSGKFRSTVTRYIGLFVAGVIGALTVSVGPDLWVWLKDFWTEDYQISIQSNTDEILSNELPVGQHYITQKDPRELPPPPNESNDCLERYAWAHSPVVDGVDADSTFARLSIAAKGKDMEVTGAAVHIVERDRPVAAGYRLACRGEGQVDGENLLDIELGGSTKPRFRPDAQDEPQDLVLAINRGEREFLNVGAAAPECDCTWLLELSLVLNQDYDDPQWVTVGPDAWVEGRAEDHRDLKPFRTSSSLYSTEYHFVNGRWQVAEGESDGACRLIKPEQLREYFGRPADQGSTGNGFGGICTWAPETGISAESLQLMVLRTTGVDDGLTQLDEFLDSASRGDPNTVGTQPRELNGVGDRAVYFGTFVYIVKGSMLYTLGAAQDGDPRFRDALVPLAESVADQFPG